MHTCPQRQQCHLGMAGETVALRNCVVPEAPLITLVQVICLSRLQIDEKKEAHISAPVMLRRSDKRKDRVEISPEQLSGAAEFAERLAEELQRPMRVIGWYHSHPHITVWPSHVGEYIVFVNVTYSNSVM